MSQAGLRISCAMPPTALLRRPRTWFIAVPIIVLLAVVVGPWVYINFIREDAPDRLTLDDRTTTTAATDATGDTTGDTTASTDAAAGGIEGDWVVGEGSTAGYRANEVLFGQDAEAAGRTSDVTGTLTIEGTTVTAAEVVVDMTTIASDEPNRDGQFRGRIMDTATFPTATFTLTEPVDLGAVPADGEEITVELTGELTLRGVTNVVTATLSAVLDGETFAVAGSIPISFDDYQIPDASGGPASVGRDGEVELLLVFAR